jgi:hypothetical protein
MGKEDSWYDAQDVDEGETVVYVPITPDDWRRRIAVFVVAEPDFPDNVLLLQEAVGHWPPPTEDCGDECPNRSELEDGDEGELGPCEFKECLVVKPHCLLGQEAASATHPRRD